MTDTIFRVKKDDVVEEAKAPEPRETPNLVEEKIDGALRDVGETDEVERVDPLEEWETKNGKYGIEFFGIKEIAGQFPYKLYFGTVDGYIKSEMQSRGLERTPASWQSILSEMEEEIGSSKLDVFSRLKKLSEYAAVLKKYRAAKEKRDSFRRVS